MQLLTGKPGLGGVDGRPGQNGILSLEGPSRPGGRGGCRSGTFRRRVCPNRQCDDAAEQGLESSGHCGCRSIRSRQGLNQVPCPPGKETGTGSRPFK